MTSSSKAPDAARAVAQYRNHARGYDASAQRTMRLRSRTIDKLCLRPGDRVLDVASGTGLSFPLLHDAVGEQGEIIGIDISPEMMDRARQRVAEAGWRNVRLLETAIDTADIPGQLDAVLLNFTHDVMRSRLALERIFAAMRPGARVAIAGMKYVPWWMSPVNFIVRAKARPYMTTFEGLEKPWDLALPYLTDFQWQSELFGIGYIGWGRVREADDEDNPRSTESHRISENHEATV